MTPSRSNNRPKNKRGKTVVKYVCAQNQNFQEICYIDGGRFSGFCCGMMHKGKIHRCLST